MRQPILTGLLPDLQKPLRDAFRGMSAIAGATEEMLDPAAKLLPRPVRDRFRDALSAVGNAGKGLTAAPVGPGQIRMAADFVRGRTGGREGAENCAAVFCCAWERLQEAAPDPRLLISETFLAGQLARLPASDPSSPGAAAAALVSLVRSSNVIGRLPGVAAGVSDRGRDTIDLGVTAIVVWLLAARDGRIAEEEKLLSLSAALVAAVRDDVLGVIDQPDKLAELLLNASAHL